MPRRGHRPRSSIPSRLSLVPEAFLKNLFTPALVGLALGLHGSRGLAHESEIRLSPYVWMAGFTGTIGTSSSGGSVPGWSGDRLDATFDSLLENLSITGAAMLNGEWRKGRLSVFGDWAYVRVESEAASPLRPLYNDVEGEIRGNIVQGNVGWQVYGNDVTRLDVYGGVRYYDVEVDVTLTEGLFDAAATSGEDTWVDGLVGLRLEHTMDGHWRVLLAGDVGTGGSDYALQAIAAVGYRLSWGSITGGWRLLRSDHMTNDFRLDATLSGPFVGATFKF